MPFLVSNSDGSATGNMNMRHVEFSGLFPCSCCEHVSKVVYRWWNDKSPARSVSSTVHWFQRRVEIDAHCSPWLKIYKSRNHNQLQQWRPRQCFSTHCAANIATQMRTGVSSCIDGTPSPAMFAEGQETSELDIRRMEKSCMVRLNSFSGSSQLRASANTPISKENPSCRMHSWTEKSRWRRYYGVGNVVLQHVRTHNPHRTILDLNNPSTWILTKIRFTHS